MAVAVSSNACKAGRLPSLAAANSWSSLLVVVVLLTALAMVEMIDEEMMKVRFCVIGSFDCFCYSPVLSQSQY